MEKTLTVNIGGLNFQITADAYAKLKEYLDDIQARLCNTTPANTQDTLSEIEARIAEIFTDNMSYLPDRTVEVPLVERVITMIGAPEEFGDKKCPTPPPIPADPNHKRLYRSRKDRMLSGVCGGIAEYFGVEPWVVRLITVILTIVGGVTILIYIILWIIIPEKKQQWMSPKI